MKWLSIFSGELNNAATYPCPFANVRMDELQERGHTLGDGSGHKWQPWSYQFRENVVSKVSKFKKTLKAPKIMQPRLVGIVKRFVRKLHSSSPGKNLNLSLGIWSNLQNVTPYT